MTKIEASTNERPAARRALEPSRLRAWGPAIQRVGPGRNPLRPVAVSA